MSQPMITGSVSRQLIRFTIPLIVSGILQQLYTIADSVIVGNLIGDLALATIGASSPVVNVFVFVVTGLVSGYTILLSQFYGAGEHEKITRLSSVFSVFLTAAAIAVAIPGFLLKDGILGLLHTPEELMTGAGQYLSVMFVGVPFVVIYNLESAMLRAVGNSKTPLYAILLSSVLNIFLDLLFIGPMKLGVWGAAVATVTAQAASCLFLLMRIRRSYPMFRISLRRKDWDFALFGESLRLGIPQVVQSSLHSVGGLLLQNVMNSFGSGVVTAITTAYKVDSLTILPLINISTALSVFTGQNVGAGNHERAREGLRAGMRIVLLVSICITAIFVSCGGVFMQAFGVSAGVVAIGWRFFRTCAVFYPILGIQSALTGFLQGNKDTMFIMIASVASLGLRVILAYLLAAPVGSDIIALAEMASWVFGTVLFVWRYKSGGWQKNSATISD